jgi:hypothetical protein
MEQGFIFRERRASISTKPDGEQSEYDREWAERSRLGRSPANDWAPVPQEELNPAGPRITVVTTGIV